MSDEFQQADPGARRSALTLALVIAVVGGALMGIAYRLRPAAENWAQHDPGSRLSVMLILLGAITALPLLGLAWYFIQLGRRIVRAERFPPPGVAVTRDTRVLTGTDAVRRGRWAQGTGVFIAMVAIAAAVVLWRLASLW